MYTEVYQKIHRNCVVVPKEDRMWSILAKQLKDVNLKSNVNLIYFQANISPILVGIFKPTIILPMTNYNTSQSIHCSISFN